MNGSILRFPIILLAVFVSACSSLSVGGEQAPLYAAGATCNTSDRGSVIPCPGHDGVTTCIYQVCDPLTLTASTCEVYSCTSSTTPPAFIPSDGGTGCTPGATAACTTPGPSFRPGTMICDVSGNWQECIPTGMPFDAGPSGVILDGGIVGTACNTDPEVMGGVACTVGVGACRGTGVWMCDASNVKVCSAMAGTPTSEGVAPDGVDNDCNGLVDDAIVRGCYSGPAGTSGIGVCRPGTQSFIPSTMTWTVCAGQVLPSTEVADNAIDEDCNGALLLSAPCGADPRIGLACSAGIGACRNTGVYSCVGNSLVCNAVAGSPAPEACDNLDNDCDGVIDGNVESCYTGPVGTASIGSCRAGTRTCTAGVFGACTGETLPALEVCGNALDEDCNGINDACVSCGSDPRVGSACAAGIGACLRTGIYTCAAGVVSCNAIIGSPTDEACNAIDDDCDGTVDEDVMRSCGSFDLSLAGRGICRAGAQTCLGVDGTGAPVFSACAGAVAPATEVCGDTVDQDCSGSDLACTSCGGDPRIGTACTVGRGACAATGTYQCMSGSDFRCVTTTTPAMPTPEVCDGIDNDCNGLVDDATGGGSLTRVCYPFTTGAPGVGICRSGTQVCSAGSFGACSGAVGPATEICDTLDNDCDGGVNEGLACSDAGTPSADAGVDSGVDAGTSSSDAGTDAGAPAPAGTAAAERAACREIRAAQGTSGTITLTYDLACLNATFGTCAAGWSPAVYDSNGCFVPADPGTVSVTVDLAMTSSDPSSFYRTGLRCGGPGGTRFAFPGPSGTPAESQCVTSWVINGVSRQGSICNGAGGLLPTFSANPTVARYTCP